MSRFPEILRIHLTFIDTESQEKGFRHQGTSARPRCEAGLLPYRLCKRVDRTAREGKSPSLLENLVCLSAHWLDRIAISLAEAHYLDL
jgi:hypothetical protein